MGCRVFSDFFFFLIVINLSTRFWLGFFVVVVVFQLRNRNSMARGRCRRGVMDDTALPRSVTVTCI